MRNPEDSSALYYNISKQTTTFPVHKYENVHVALQMRNKRENDQEVNANHSDEHLNHQRSVMSAAKSSFFGLNDQQVASPNSDYEGMTDDNCEVYKLLPTERHPQLTTMNSPLSKESKRQSDQEKNSTTSSASGSSSATVSPMASPIKEHDRSKSPKFMLPESSFLQPTQTVYMATTVPQNIKGQNIMGRHKPTRNSLRHSRMIVTSKHIQGASHLNSLNIRHVWLAKFVLLLKIITGFSILILGGWICLFANSTPIQQNPFWSGLVLIISGLLGSYLLNIVKRTRSKLKKKFFWFLKMIGSVIMILSVFLTTLALIYASFHYVNITSENKKCFPENVFINSSSCICVFNVSPDTAVARESLLSQTSSVEGTNIVHFKDLSCNELPTWAHILLASMILNFIGLVLSVCFMTQFIFGCKRRSKKPAHPT